MTKKIDASSLKDFNSAHFLNNNEDIRAYIQLVDEEGDISALSDVLNTVFLAIGANAIAKALDINVGRVWDAQMQPSEHLDDSEKIIKLIKKLPQN